MQIAVCKEGRQESFKYAAGCHGQRRMKLKGAVVVVMVLARKVAQQGRRSPPKLVGRKETADSTVQSRNLILAL